MEIALPERDVKFGIKIRSDSSQMGQIENFLRPVSEHSETDLKNSQICPMWGQSDLILMPNLTSLMQYFHNL